MEYHNNLVTLTDTFYNSHKTLLEKVGLYLKLEPKEIEDLVQKFVGNELKIKPMKDPNRPKRAKTSYMFFCAEKRKELSEKNPDLRMTQLSKLLGKLWKDTPANQKQKYIDLANKDKNRYQEDIEQYKEFEHY